MNFSKEIEMNPFQTKVLKIVLDNGFSEIPKRFSSEWPHFKKEISPSESKFVTISPDYALFCLGYKEERFGHSGRETDLEYIFKLAK